MRDRFEQIYVFDGLIKFPMSRGSIDLNRPTSKVAHKPLNDRNGEEE